MTDTKPRGVNDEIGSAVRRVFGSGRTRGQPAWLDGILVENLRMEVAADTQVTHRLGRKPRGFLVVSVRMVDTSDNPIGPVDMMMRKCDTARATMWLCGSTSPGATKPRIYSLWFW